MEGNMNAEDLSDKPKSNEEFNEYMEENKYEVQEEANQKDVKDLEAEIRGVVQGIITGLWPAVERKLKSDPVHLIKNEHYIYREHLTLDEYK